MCMLTYCLCLKGGERGGSVVECRTPEREVRGSRPTAAVSCPWARHFTPRKYWLITQEAMAPSRHDWKIVDWDVKPQHNQPTICLKGLFSIFLRHIMRKTVLSYAKRSAQSDQRLCCSLRMIPVLAKTNFSTIYSFCSWAGRFESYLVANAESSFTHDVAYSVSSHADVFGRASFPGRTQIQVSDVIFLDCPSLIFM